MFIPINFLLLVNRRTRLSAWVLALGIALFATLPYGGRADAQSLPGEAGDAPCLLLRNGNVVFGEAEQQGEQVVLRRGDGSYLKLDRREVLCWGRTLLDLYQYRVDHRVTGSAGVHLSDARWCLRYGLLDQAGEELDFLSQLDPSNRQVALLQRQLEGARANTRPDAQRSLPPDDHSRLSPAAVTYDDSRIDVVDQEAMLAAVDVNLLHQFTAQIQPILINQCGSCHAHHSERNWRIVKPAHGIRPSSRMSRDNFIATASYLDRHQPEQSEILRYAVTPHGDGPSPLGPRNAVAIDALQYWVRSVAAQQLSAGMPNGYAGERTSLAPIPTPPPLSNFSQEEPDRPAAWPRTTGWPGGLDSSGGTSAWAAGESTTPSQRPSSAVPTSLGVKRLPPVANPFDPEIFNRRFHRADAEEPSSRIAEYQQDGRAVNID